MHDAYIGITGQTMLLQEARIRRLPVYVVCLVATLQHQPRHQPCSFWFRATMFRAIMFRAIMFRATTFRSTCLAVQAVLWQVVDITLREIRKQFFADIGSFWDARDLYHAQLQALKASLPCCNHYLLLVIAMAVVAFATTFRPNVMAHEASPGLYTKT